MPTRPSLSTRPKTRGHGAPSACTARARSSSVSSVCAQRGWNSFTTWPGPRARTSALAPRPTTSDVAEPALLVAQLGSAHTRAAVAEFRVALAQRRLQPLLAGLAHELARAGRQVPARVVLAGQPLQGARAHQLEAQVDDALVRRE